MKKFKYTLGNIDYDILFIGVFLSFISLPLVYLLTLDRDRYVFFMFIFFSISFSLIMFFGIRVTMRPHNTRYWIIDEKGKRIINQYKENEEVTYAFSDIERITYSHKKASISIKLKNKPRKVYFMKIYNPQVDDFEHEMKACGERYGFTFRMMR